MEALSCFYFVSGPVCTQLQITVSVDAYRTPNTAVRCMPRQGAHRIVVKMESLLRSSRGVE